MKKKFRKNILFIFHTYAFYWKLDITTVYSVYQYSLWGCPRPIPGCLDKSHVILFFKKIKTKSNGNANSPCSVPMSVNETQKRVKWITFYGWKMNKIFFYDLFLHFFLTLLEAMYWYLLFKLVSLANLMDV